MGRFRKILMCLFYPEVQRRYQELIRDAVASFPGIDGFVFLEGIPFHWYAMKPVHAVTPNHAGKIGRIGLPG